MKPPVNPHTALTADQSCSMMTELYRGRIPFFFTKYGDGYLECVFQLATGRTCDQEIYTQELAESLKNSVRRLYDLHQRGIGAARNLILADWFTADFDAKMTGLYPVEYRRFVQPVSTSAIFVNYESLLIDRHSLELVDFYAAIRDDRDRKKIIIGPAEWNEAQHGVLSMLRAHGFQGLPARGGVMNLRQEIFARLVETMPDVVLYGAGMAGTVPVIDYLVSNPQATCINLGSALDPLFRGRTRLRQLPTADARKLFASILR